MVYSLAIQTKNKQEIIDITDKVQEAIKKSGIKQGTCIVFTPHTTAGILINECTDKNLHQDILNKLEQLIPTKSKYKHNCEDGGCNAHAHIKSSIIGASKIIFIENNKLLLGTWQRISYCEFDGPRQRKVHIKVLKD
ncbi:MAG: secondary thiamine-phosphate synthase enzyme YjbQ [Nanoarchaeota archaeon]|nr:secondary thiamine-phosphate synthase enzyme YjbQ [Nanoarchaeota archaeon]